MSGDWPIKDPREIASYTFDWSRELDTGETISSHSIAVTGGLVVDSSADTSTTVTALISAGDLGETAEVECTVVTTGGQTLIDSRFIPIRTK